MKNRLHSHKALAIILILIMMVSQAACQAPTAPPQASQRELSDMTSSGAGSAPEDESGIPGASENSNAGAAASPTPETPEIPVAVTGIRIVLSSTEIVKGTVLSPDITILPDNATDKDYTLISSDETVLLQTDDGFLAVSGGTAEIIATSADGATSRARVTVIVPVESVSFETDRITLAPDESVTLAPVIAPSDTTDSQVSFSSSDVSVATVDEDGAVLGVAAGTAVIECTAGNISASVNVTVAIPVTGISVRADRLIYTVGDQGSLTVQFSPEDATDKTFAINVRGGAEFGEENLFICTAAGEAVFTVTAVNGTSSSFTIYVIDLAAFADEVFKLTNIERMNADLPLFEQMEPLTRTAEVRANEIVTYFSHTRPDGREFFTAFDENNVDCMWAGENLAMGQRTPEDVVRAWMESPGHRAAILSSDFGHLGVGIAIDSNGTLFWAQTFTD